MSDIEVLEGQVTIHRLNKPLVVAESNLPLFHWYTDLRVIDQDDIMEKVKAGTRLVFHDVVGNLYKLTVTAGEVIDDNVVRLYCVTGG